MKEHQEKLERIELLEILSYFIQDRQKAKTALELIFKKYHPELYKNDPK